MKDNSKVLFPCSCTSNLQMLLEPRGVGGGGSGEVLRDDPNTYTHTYTIYYFKHDKNVSYKIEIFEKKTGLHVCPVGVQRGQLAVNLISKVAKRSNGSDIGWKAIPQMCPTVAETIGTL